MSVAALCSMSGAMWAAEETKTADRLNDAAALFHEVMSTPDKSIPQDLLNKSHCIILVPGLKKGGFVVGQSSAGALRCAAARRARDGARPERCASKAGASAFRSASLPRT